jgi:molybdate transport system substrate-binding protein
LLTALFLLLLAPFFPESARAADVAMFAAASTTDALGEIARAYEAEGRGRIAISFASSSTLARQIENGAPADLYLSADEAWMDYLAQRNLIVPTSRIDYLGNALVLIAPKDSALALRISPGFPLAASLGDGRLAMGDPDHVPAGIYGKAALEKLGVWQQVASRLARAEDVRGALAYVERGEAAAGIVYATDAARAEVRVVATFPPDTHPPIRYPMALVAGRDTPAARAFYDYLRGPAARAVFERYGFTLD